MNIVCHPVDVNGQKRWRIFWKSTEGKKKKKVGTIRAAQAKS
jgi:hypothetical protein